MKTKLEMIRKALSEDLTVAVVAIQQHCDAGGSLSFSHTVRICVAPKTGIYDAKMLNAFMLNLVPGLKPTLVDEISVGIGFRVGVLYFNEIVTVPAGNLTDDGTPSVPVQRRTRVAVYPDQVMAHSGAASEYLHYVPLDALNESVREKNRMLAEALGVL